MCLTLKIFHIFCFKIYTDSFSFQNKVCTHIPHEDSFQEGGMKTQHDVWTSSLNEARQVGCPWIWGLWLHRALGKYDEPENALVWHSVLPRDQGLGEYQLHPRIAFTTAPSFSSSHPRVRAIIYSSFVGYMEILPMPGCPSFIQCVNACSTYQFLSQHVFLHTSLKNRNLRLM